MGELNHQSSVLGMDLGGTHLRYGLVSQDGRFLFQKKILVGKKRNEEEVFQKIVQGIEEVLKEAPECLGIGIGVPGIVSEGVIYSSPHFPQWKNFHLFKKISQKYSLPLLVDNDANFHGLAESEIGQGQDWDSFLMVTLGTGIGGALILEKKIFHGTRGFAGEFGHFQFSPEGPPCNCGSSGCFETYASASGLLRMICMKEHASWKETNFEALETNLWAEKLFELARQGDGIAQDICSIFASYLGRGLASLILITGVQKIVLGGGLMGGSAQFLDQAQRVMQESLYVQMRQEIEIKKSTLEEPGVLGAAYGVWDQVSTKD